MPSSCVQIVEDSFGQIKQPITDELVTVRRFTFSNPHNGVRIQVITYGAIISSVVVPNNRGVCEDVALGFDNAEGFVREAPAYFGATMGRVCNRIANGTFRLGAHTYAVTKNQPGFQLHGGTIGFDKFNWDAVIVGDSVRMSHLNPDGFQGFPGAVLATATFRLAEDNAFSVAYQATSTKPTPVNITNHAYFNLAGHNAGAQELYKHVVTINADRITDTDASQIPTGQFRPVIGTAYDLRVPRELAAVMKELPRLGYDDNFCVAAQPNQALQFVAAVRHRDSGRSLEVYSDQPGVQFYTSNNLPDPRNEIYPAAGLAATNQSPNQTAPVAGRDGAQYRKHGAFCLETQKYPDSVNHDNFPSTIINPGDVYKHHVVYKFLTDAVEIVPMK